MDLELQTFNCLLLVFLLSKRFQLFIFPFCLNDCQGLFFSILVSFVPMPSLHILHPGFLQCTMNSQHELITSVGQEETMLCLH